LLALQRRRQRVVVVLVILAVGLAGHFPGAPGRDTAAGDPGGRVRGGRRRRGADRQIRSVPGAGASGQGERHGGEKRSAMRDGFLGSPARKKLRKRRQMPCQTTINFREQSQYNALFFSQMRPEHSAKFVP
jgi:hypothetical protein